MHRRFGDPVHEDSCVELFLQPRPGAGYFNFEWNAGGTLHASHVIDPRRVGGTLGGQAWRANLYKCGDKTSHPHWASWAPIDARNFHLPHCFGTLEFEAKPA